jgi:hypothetical protein
MAQNTTVKLKIPRQDLSQHSLFLPNVDAVKDWTQRLPVANTDAVVAALDQALDQLNRLPLSPEIRYKLLEVLRPSLEVALSNLSRRFLNQPLVMPAEPQQMADRCNRLYTLAGTGYTIVAVDAIKRRDEIRDSNPARLTCEAIHRALLFTGGRILQSFQLYKPLEIHAWQGLHQLYALAESQGLAQLPIPEPLSGGGTIQSTYLQAVMLGCCKPNQLRQSDLAALYRGLQEWSDLVKLDSARGEDDLFLVDLKSDQPPLYCSLYRNEPGELCRYINTGELIKHLQSLKEESGTQGVSFDKNSVLPANMLDHLIASLGSTSLRNFTRTSADSSLWVCIGLSSCHYHVSGERTFDRVLFGDAHTIVEEVASGNALSPGHQGRDKWEDANPREDYLNGGAEQDHEIDLDARTRARLLQEDEDTIPPDERYKVYKADLADVSPGGYCLAWDEQLPADTHTGDIVGLQEEEEGQWSIAVIRWLSRVKDARTLLGLELLSPGAVPYGARIHRKGGEKGPPLRVLLLPEIKLVGQPPTLVTPRTGFKERQKVTLRSFAGEFTVKLTRQVAATGSFAQFEFTRVKELGDALSETFQGRFEDLDSIWSNI